MAWMQKIRLRVLAVLLALTLGVITAISISALPVWPVVGVAIAAAALALNTISSKLTQPVCWGCGADLSGCHATDYGVACPSCGSVTQRLHLAAPGSDRDPR